MYPFSLASVELVMVSFACIQLRTYLLCCINDQRKECGVCPWRLSRSEVLLPEVSCTLCRGILIEQWCNNEVYESPELEKLFTEYLTIKALAHTHASQAMVKPLTLAQMKLQCNHFCSGVAWVEKRNGDIVTKRIHHVTAADGDLPSWPAHLKSWCLMPRV